MPSCSWMVGPEISVKTRIVCKYLECDGLPVLSVDHTGSLRASLHQIAGQFHE